MYDRRKNLFIYNYLLIVLVSALMLFPLYYSCVRLFETRQLTLNQSILKNGVDQLSQQLSSLSTLSSNLGSNIDYRILATRRMDQLSARDILVLDKLKKEFQQLSSAQSLATQVGLLMQNGTLFLDTRLFTRDQSYYGSYLAYRGINQAQWMEKLRKVGSMNVFWPGTEVTYLPEHADESLAHSYRCITWASNISGFTTSDPLGIFFATFSEDTLKKLLLTGLDSGAGVSVCTVYNGEEMIRLGDESVFSDQNTHVIEYENPSSPLRVRLLITGELFYSQTKPIRNLLLLFIILLVAIGTLAALSLSRLSMQPINKLFSLVNGQKFVKPAGRSGFGYLVDAFSGMVDSVNRYQIALDEQHRRDAEHTFEHFIITPYIDTRSVSQARRDRFARYFPTFPAAFRLAILTAVEYEENYLEKLNICLNDALQDVYTEACPYAQRYENTFILVLDANTPIEKLLDVRRRLAKAAPGKLLVTLSETFQGFDHLFDAFRQATELAYLARTQGEILEVWCVDNFPNASLKTRQSGLLSYQELSHFYDALVRGASEEVYAFLSCIKHCFSPTCVTDVALTQQMFYNIRGILLQIKLEHFSDLYSLDIPNFLHINQSLSGSYPELEKCCVAICEAMQQNINNIIPFSKQLCEYIDQNITNPELYARMVADHFNISETTLQKMVRLEKKCSFFQYTENVRCAMAVRLLIETEDTIAQIATSCGYHSINSFYKAFKRHNGETPRTIRTRQRA